MSSRVDSCMVWERFASADQCAQLLARVAEYRSRNAVPVVERANGELPLRYAVIDGDRIAAHLPEVLRVYERVTHLVKSLWHDEIEPLTDRKVACNINITQPGGSYRYHYDRNALTAILYLNEIEGGETECYPGYRIALAQSRYTALQQKLDGLLRNRFVRGVAASQLLVRPRVGRLLLMQGNRCLHSVRPVHGPQERINIIMSYDRPNARFEVADNLNTYLYSTAETSANDPNYVT